MYGGSLLFVSTPVYTPLVSPCQSIGVCSELPIDQIHSINLSDLNRVVCGRWACTVRFVKMGKVLSLVIRRRLRAHTLSSMTVFYGHLIDFLPRIPLPSSQSVLGLVMTTLRAGNDDLKSSTSKESTSWASGSTN